MDHSLVMVKVLVKLNEAMSHAKQDHPKGVDILESMSHAKQDHPKWVDILKSSDKTWSPGGGNSKPLQ